MGSRFRGGEKIKYKGMLGTLREMEAVWGVTTAVIATTLRKEKEPRFEKGSLSREGDKNTPPRSESLQGRVWGEDMLKGKSGGEMRGKSKRKRGSGKASRVERKTGCHGERTGGEWGPPGTDLASRSQIWNSKACRKDRPQRFILERTQGESGGRQSIWGFLAKTRTKRKEYQKWELPGGGRKVRKVGWAPLTGKEVLE